MLNEGKTSIVRREHDSNTGRIRYFFMRFSDFERWLANRGGPRENLARSWMKSSRRREYPNGITMAPIGEEPPGTFNLWTGFTVESQPGSWGYMREHLPLHLDPSFGTDPTTGRLLRRRENISRAAGRGYVWSTIFCGARRPQMLSNIEKSIFAQSYVCVDAHWPGIIH